MCARLQVDAEPTATLFPPIRAERLAPLATDTSAHHSHTVQPGKWHEQFLKYGNV